MSRYRVLPWVLVVAASAAADDDGGLAHTNAVLQVWLEAIEADAPYLLMDRGAAELRLMHGGAVLRRMAVVADSLGARPPVRTGQKELHLRRRLWEFIWMVWNPFQRNSSRNVTTNMVN